MHVCMCYVVYVCVYMLCGVCVCACVSCDDACVCVMWVCMCVSCMWCVCDVCMRVMYVCVCACICMIYVCACICVCVCMYNATYWACRDTQVLQTFYNGWTQRDPTMVSLSSYQNRTLITECTRSEPVWKPHINIIISRVWGRSLGGCLYWIVSVCKNPQLGVLVGAHLCRGITFSSRNLLGRLIPNAKKSE